MTLLNGYPFYWELTMLLSPDSFNIYGLSLGLQPIGTYTTTKSDPSGERS